MELQDREFRVAIDIANRFLARWGDRFTRNAREDLVQETVLEVWRCGGRVRDPDRFEAFVRTVSRRVRYRALRDDLRRAQASCEQVVLRDSAVAESALDDNYRVGGAWVQKSWLLGELERVCSGLTELNRTLVREFYAGRSCRDLAAQFGLAEQAVKVRIYRARQRLHREFVGRAQRAFATA